MPWTSELNEPHRPFMLSRRIIQNFYNDECEVCIVYGMPEGIGKSAYVAHVNADVCGYRDSRGDQPDWVWKYKQAKERGQSKWAPNYEAVKPALLYYPRDVVKRCKEMLLKHQRLEMVWWDDAGTWLNAMDFNDPFVVAFMAYISLARSNWAMIILTTPVEDWVLKKLKTATGVLHCEIIKTAGHTAKERPRRARGYKIVKYKNRIRPYYQSAWEDDFKAMMPDDFYGWYKPIRDSYALAAAAKMDAALNKREKSPKLSGVVKRDRVVLESIKESVAKGNDESVDLLEMLEQAGG